MSNSTAPKLLAEFIGTFALVFIGAGAASIVGGAAGLGGITAVAFAHGLTVLVFVCAYGSISGGHVNPAVTVGVLAAGAITAAEAAGYIVCQIAGGVAAALLLRIVLGGVASYPQEIPEAGEALKGAPLSDESVAAAAEAAYRPSKPMDNTDFDLSWRKQMTRVYVTRAIEELRERHGK